MNKKISNTNETAVLVLQDLGFSIKRIRAALPRLTDITHSDVARIAGVTRQDIGHHMTGIRAEKNVQRTISQMYGVSKEVLFPDG